MNQDRSQEKLFLLHNDKINLQPLFNLGFKLRMSHAKFNQQIFQPISPLKV